MKNIAIDWLIPLGSGFLIAQLGITIARWVYGTEPPPFLVVWPLIWLSAVFFGAVIYPPLARWLKG